MEQENYLLSPAIKATRRQGIIFSDKTSGLSPKAREKRIGAYQLFVVDASGSMAASSHGGH